MDRENSKAPHTLRNSAGHAGAGKPRRLLTDARTIVGRDRFWWRRAGDVLILQRGKSRKPLTQVEPDLTWHGLFRVRAAGGLSDLLNLTRAKDAALTAALRHLNYKAQEKPSQVAYVRHEPRQVGMPLADRKQAPAPSKRLRGFA